jgi:unsaturated rhamnogalacturonyl hydrolase
MKDVQKFVMSFLDAYKPYKDYWNYEDGCVLIGCIDLYQATGDAKYRQFVLDYLSARVEEDGSIPAFEKKFNIDSINSGKALFFALKETGEERYRKAIEFHMDRLRQHPRCQCGNFWHKAIYPEQIWLDGLYMAQPFYMAYETQFDGLANVVDIVNQFKNVRKYLYDEEKKLSYHACDMAKEQPWANKETGCSKNFWLRSMGWYLMAMIDCIGILGPDKLYEHYKALVDLFRETIRGILCYQDAETGLFYQVIDHGEVEGNYLETSGSSMVAYAILKAVRLGVLDAEKYEKLGLKAFEHLVSDKLLPDENGNLHLTDICWVAGLGPGEKRDGSVAYYLSEPKVSDDSKGVGPFMMAYAEYLNAEKNA